MYHNNLNKAVKSGTTTMTKKNKVKKILNQYRSNTGCVSIVDFFTTVDDVLSGKFTYDVISFCDSNCSNGHFSRWTNFGADLVNDAVSFTDKVRGLH